MISNTKGVICVGACTYHNVKKKKEREGEKKVRRKCMLTLVKKKRAVGKDKKPRCTHVGWGSKRVAVALMGGA